MGLIDSYLYDFVCATACTDSNAIHLGGNSPTVQEGPFKVVDNYLEASGENYFAGGGGTGAGCCTIPSDIEIRRNHVFKPAQIWQESWPDSNSSTVCAAGNGCDNNPNYFGTKVIVKNLGEFKNGQRILIEGNIFENNWGGQSDQFGNVIQFNPVSQNKNVNGCASYDMTSGDVVSSPCGVDQSGKQIQGNPIQFTPLAVSPDCATPDECHISMGGSEPNRTMYAPALQFVSSTEIVVGSGLATSSFTGQMIYQCEPGGNPLATVSNVTVRDNILRHAARGIQVNTYLSQCGDASQAMDNVSIHDNQMDDINGWQWNLKKGACCAWGWGVEIGNVATNQALSTDNISITHNTLLSAEQYNAGFEGSVLVYSSCGSTCTTQVPNITIRDNIGAGGLTDAGDKKNDYCNATNQNQPSTALFNCYGETSPSLGWCITGNAFANGTIPNNPNYPPPSPNLPYPTASPACPGGVSTLNYNPADYTSFDFVNLNNANGGNYQLASSSPYIDKASDGTNPGANISAVNAATAGVY
jgi:hypothetical protein